MSQEEASSDHFIWSFLFSKFPVSKQIKNVEILSARPNTSIILIEKSYGTKTLIILSSTDFSYALSFPLIKISHFFVNKSYSIPDFTFYYAE